VTQLYSGTFLSALDMKGVSLSLLPLDRARSAQLAAPTQAPAWRLASTPTADKPGDGGARTLPTPAPHTAETRRPITLTDTGRQLEVAITAACAALIAAEGDLNDLDRRVGDGDCGTTLRRGAERVKRDLDAHYPLNDAAATLQALGTSLAQATGGSTGVLYAIFFEAAARALRAAGSWTGALRAGTEAVSSYGGARRGDRTMLDALFPAAEAADHAYRSGADAREVLRAAAGAAEAGAEHTRTLGRAQAGRSAYLGQDALRGTADPGAYAVSLWLRAVARAHAPR
jgi:triose/dihydroxyacetone kinase / FAD-AMP lyase (cyclizing)